MNNKIDTMCVRSTSSKNWAYFEPSGCIIRSSWDIWLDAQKSSSDEVIAKGALKLQRKLAGKRLKFTMA